MKQPIRYCFVFGIILFIRSLSFSQTDDRIICNRVFSYAFEHKLIENPVGDIVAEVGKQFLGKPYEAGTLDQPGAESLVVNLHSFDCVTFVENVLALSRCISTNHLSFESYKTELQSIRYRNGIINGYASRLHYFSDWIYENQLKGLIQDLTKELGGVPYNKPINFITTNKNLYPKVTGDSVFQAMKIIEDSINTRLLYYIPKLSIVNCQSKIENGDIIAITTDREGLDVSHVGIAVRMKDGFLHYMHAPDVKGVVRISDEPLTEYLTKHMTQTGIIVVRPISHSTMFGK